MTELKPCPFCGDTYIMTHHTKHCNYVIGCNTLSCVCLWTEGKLYSDKEKAIEAWNRRVK